VRITAAKELEGALMARDPVGDLLGARRFGVGVVQGAQRGDEQLMHERVMFLPLTEPAFLNGVGARVAESGLGLIGNYLYSAPYEDLKLKAP
jgi:hypothetical protein